MEVPQLKSSNRAAVIWLILFFPVGLFVMWAKTNWNKKVKIAISGVFALFILSMMGGDRSRSSSSSPINTQATKTEQTSVTEPTPSPTPEATATPVPKDINGFPMDAEKVTVAELDKSPSQYEGKKVTFSCTVSSFAKDSSGNAAAVNCYDPNNYSTSIQVSIFSFDVTRIHQDDKIRFYGICSGSAEGKNAFGATLKITVVDAIAINDLTSGYRE